MPTMLERLARAYAALGKAPADERGPLARRTDDREHVWGLGLSSVDVAAGMEADRYVGHATIYRQYVWVRKAVVAITTPLAPLPVRVVGPDGSPVAGHPLQPLLERPNAQMDWPELTELTIVHKLLGGEYFLEVVADQRGRPVELWPRRPDHVLIVPDARYPGYPIPAGYHVEGIDPPHLGPDALIHERFVHPLNDWRGISVIGAARDEIAVDLATLLNTRETLREGSRSYAITAADVLTPAERERVERQLYEKYGRSRPMLLESGQSVATIGSAPDDLQWLAARDYSREAVGALFGVPDEIMGFGRDTYENFGTAMKVLWRLTLLPMAQRRDATLTHFFRAARPLLRPGERIATDISGVEELQEQLGPKLEQASALWAMGVPYNVVEAKLGLGTGPIPGGDVGYLPMGLAPVGAAPPVEPAPQRSVPARRVKGGRWEDAAPDLGPQERAIERAARRYLRGQYALAARQLRELMAGKAAKDAVAIVEQLGLDLGDALGAVMREHYGLLLALAWGRARDTLGVDLAFDLANPRVQDVLGELARRVRRVCDATRDDIRAIVGRMASEGLSPAEAADLIAGLGGVHSQQRALAIAVTEAADAYTRGAVLAWGESGMVDRQRWLAEPDACDICQGLNGQVVRLGAAFPGGRSVPAHPLCKCALEPVLIGE